MKNKPDTILVAQAREGKHSAFTELVRRYQGYAYGIAIGLLSDFELSRDVVQEAFLCAYCDLPKLSDPKRFGGWLRSVVRNTAFRALRERERVRRIADEMARTSDPVDPQPTPDRHIELTERRQLVTQALDRLSDKNREAISLYYLQDLSYAEIATLLGVRESAVVGRLQRGRSQLRKELIIAEETFRDEALPEDFSVEIGRILASAAKSSPSRVNASIHIGQERRDAIKKLSDFGAPAAEILCDSLEDSRHVVRTIAAKALCHIGDVRALRPMLRILYSDTAWRFGSIFEDGSVLSIPGIREVLLDEIKNQDTPNRSMAIYALGNLVGDDEVFESILHIFEDAHADVRTQRAAMSALGTIKPEAALGVITMALQKSDLRMREWAIRCAAHRGTLPPIDACLKAFSSGIGPMGRVLAGQLILHHGESGRSALRDIIRDGTPGQRSTAAAALVGAGHTEFVDVLKESLLDRNESRKWLKGRVMQLVRRHCGDDLLGCMEASGYKLKDIHPVAWGWSPAPPSGALLEFEDLYHNGTPAQRAAAVRVLARARGADFLPELRKCLCRGKPQKVSREAFWQTYRLRDAALPTVEKMRRSENWNERRAAVSLLRSWGRLTPEDADLARRDEHIAVRNAAAWSENLSL